MSSSSITPESLPLVAIVGRPNVGKSALFNRILGRRLAIVHEECGVTRDRIMAPTTYEDRRFMVVDTGGIGFFLDEKRIPVFDELIREQVQTVLADAALVVFVVDSIAGETPLDEEIAQYLRRCNCPVLVAVNKCDAPEKDEPAMKAFACLGFDTFIPTSCQHGRGIYDLLDSILATLPPVPEADEAVAEIDTEDEIVADEEVTEDGEATDDTPAAAPKPRQTLCLRIAVAGRPNVGKSSIVNRLLGQQRMIVSDIAGTTRDAINTPFLLKHGDREVPAVMVDTAGLRKKQRVDTPVELFSMIRAKKAIELVDVVLLVLDASLPATAQDRRIARIIVDAGKPCIIVVNKWDLVSATTKLDKFLEDLRRDMPFMAHAPLVTISAKEQKHLTPVLASLIKVADALQIKIPTSVLNQFLRDLVTRTPPTIVSNKHLKMFYATMSGIAPPRITLFVNRKALCQDSYMQFLENRVRDAFFPESGLPVRIELRERQQKNTDGPHGGVNHAPTHFTVQPRAPREGASAGRRPPPSSLPDLSKVRPDTSPKERRRAAEPANPKSRAARLAKKLGTRDGRPPAARGGNARPSRGTPRTPSRSPRRG